MTELIGIHPMNFKFISEESMEYIRRWIKCSNQLPDVECRVLVQDKAGSSIIIAYRLEEIEGQTPFLDPEFIKENWFYKDWNWFSDGVCRIRSANILVWMPLPEPYCGDLC